ncbi:hypothetical protein [Streptomyces sp. NPDC020742]|uniref:hypothetical protein n=1 Tax=Streptomyces sp. NPDC020742 TaxID=3154897 RepID=UPI0033C59E06
MTHQPPQMPQQGYGTPHPPYPGTPVPPQNGSTPPTGLPHPGGVGFAPQPPAPPTRRTGLIVAVVLVVVVLLAGGGFLVWSMLGGGGNTEAGGNTSTAGTLPTPMVVKSTPVDLRYDAKATALKYPPEKRNPATYPEFKGLTQVDSVYHPKNNDGVILGVHTATGTVSDPAQRVQTAFAPNDMAVAPKDFSLHDPAAKGAVLRCGISQGDGFYVPLCVWADSTSVGDVTGVGDASSRSLEKIDLKALAQQASDLRKAMRSGSAG